MLETNDQNDTRSAGGSAAALPVSLKASVIIPTKNPGPQFTDVLAAVRDQQAGWPFEIVVVDSGSTDGTVDYLRRQNDVTLIEIAPAEFSHGRTRNLAISKAKGEFCALLTHDARPVAVSWLAEIVNAVEQDPQIAGAFGPHLAYPNHSVFIKRDLERHFDGFANLPLIVSREMDAGRYEREEGWRQFLHFFSDNNSCLRRSVWEQIPYPDVDFAEDQIWAKTIIDRGWKKAFAPNAAVFHSHDYGPVETMQRSFDESNAFRRLFGYRLGGSPIAAVKSAIGLMQTDWRWGRRHQIPVRHIVRRMCNDVATVAGHSLGARGERLPESVRVRLSRDKKLFYALGG